MLVLYFFKNFIFSPRAGSLIRRIAWLSIISTTVSVAAFFIVMFVMGGMNKSIQTRLLALEPHLYVTVPGTTKTIFLESHPVYQRLKENSENKAYLYETMDIIIRTNDGIFKGATARGISNESLSFMVDQLAKLESSKPSRLMVDSSNHWQRDEVPSEGEIVMGVDLARSLGVYEGDTVTVIPPESLLLPVGEVPKLEKVKIKKIIATNLSDLDAQYVFYQRGVSLKTMAQMQGVQRGIEVWTPEGTGLASLKADLEKFDGVQVETWMQRNSALFYALRLEKLCIGIFLALAGLIAGSSILTVLALLISQKKRDIAILRTIGLSGKRTVQIFTQLGASLAGVGVLMGTLIGVGLSLYIEKYPINVLPDIYYDSQIPAYVEFKLVFFILILSALVAFLGSWLPARGALDVEPSHVLRK